MVGRSVSVIMYFSAYETIYLLIKYHGKVEGKSWKYQGWSWNYQRRSWKHQGSQIKKIKIDIIILKFHLAYPNQILSIKYMGRSWKHQEH